MFIKNISIFFTVLFLTQLGFSGTVADISFSNNTWNLDNSISITNNELIITGNTNSYLKANLVKTVPVSTKNIYLVAEVFMTNIQGGPESYKWPKFKIYNNSTSSNILAYNLDENIEGKWVTTGMVIENFDKKNVSEIKIEFGFQNATGIMKIRNPQLLDAPPVSSYSFPFAIPANPNCTLNLISTDTHTFENDLLSSNSHFSWASYTWKDLQVKNLINDNFPMTTMRFPGGTVGNFYDYSTDGYYGDAYTFINNSRENAYNSGFTFDYNGYKNLCLANNSSSVLMFNVVQDDVNKAKNRLQSRINDGLTVKWIEMGNENFFSEQGLGNVSDLSKYISHTTLLSAGLKTISSSVQPAVNIEHDNYTLGSWNNELSKLNYFDACVMHPYVNTNTFLLNDVSANVMFSAFKTTTERIHNYNINFPQKPLLFTEWSILSSGTPVNFVQTLSLADMFLAIEKGNQDGIVKQAGIHMLYHSDNYNEATLSYFNGSNMVLTANGVLYAKLFDAFKDKTVYNAISSSEELKAGLPAVNAKAIQDGDSIRVFVVNKLPVASELTLTLDGQALNGNYSLTYFHENPAVELQNPYLNKNAPWQNTTGNSKPSIPAYSIGIVSYKKAGIVTNAIKYGVKTIVYPNPAKNKLQIQPAKSKKWIIFDVNGKFILEGNSSEIDISNLNPNSYFLNIDGENISFVKQ